MEILHCFGLMHRGGAETMLLNLYRNIDKNKYNFNFLVHSNETGDYDEEIINLGGKIYHTKSLGEVGLTEYISLFKKQIKKMPKIDIIHIHMDWQCGYIALAARLSGIKKIIVHSHTQGLNKSSKKKEFAVACSRKLISLFADERLACSKEAAKYLYGANDYQIINNAIDFGNFEKMTELTRLETRNDLGVTEKEILLCHIGRISENKNQIFLIKILKELIKTNDNYRLILIGRGDNYTSTLIDYINKNNLSNFVKLLGVKDDVPKYLNASDIFLFPSKREGFGMVVVEAQTSGLNCIISETVPKTVDLGMGLTCFLSIDSLYSWVDVIKEIKFTKRNKSEIREALIKNNLDIINQVKILEDVYKGLHSKR